MAKYSRVYKFGDRKFRYNYDDGVVELVFKPNKEMLDDNKEWMEKFGHPLWELSDGYCVADSVGLRRENWVDKESRDSYLGMWVDEIDEELAFEAELFVKRELL